MTNDIEHLFMCLFATCISSSMDSLYIFAHILNGSFCFYTIVFWEVFIYSRSVPLSNMWFGNIFSHSIACLFILWKAYFEEQMFLILIMYSLPIFPFNEYPIVPALFVEKIVFLPPLNHVCVYSNSLQIYNHIYI